MVRDSSSTIPIAELPAVAAGQAKRANRRRVAVWLSSRCLAGLAAVAALVAGAPPVAAEVLPWGGRGVWLVSTTLECFGPPDLFGIQGTLQLEQLGPALVAGAWSAGGTLEGEIQGKGGRTLKGRADHPDCGEGKFSFKLDGDFRTFTGTLKFPGVKGEVGALYFRDAADQYDVGLQLAFAAAKKGSIKPGRSAVLAVFLENRGPQPIPLRTLLLRLRFSGAVGFQKVAILKRLADIDFGVDLDPDVPQSMLDLPIAAGELLILAIKFRVPEVLSGTTLRVDADFGIDPDATNLGEPAPVVPAVTAFAEIEIERKELRVTFKLKNDDTQNIHIFLIDDADPFSERTRVSPGGSKSLRVVAEPGDHFRFGAGRNGVTLDTCETGSVVASGGATVTWDPGGVPLFLALRCPGGA